VSVLANSSVNAFRVRPELGFVYVRKLLIYFMFLRHCLE